MMEIADERMHLEEVDLLDRLGVLEQASQFLQSPQPVMDGALARVLQPVHGMLAREREQTLQDPHPFGAALLEQAFRPSAGVGPEQPAPLEEVVGATHVVLRLQTVLSVDGAQQEEHDDRQREGEERQLAT